MVQFPKILIGHVCSLAILILFCYTGLLLYYMEYYLNEKTLPLFKGERNYVEID